MSVSERVRQSRPFLSGSVHFYNKLCFSLGEASIMAFYISDLKF